MAINIQKITAASSDIRKRNFRNAQQRREFMWGLVLLVPSLILITVFTLYPLVGAVRYVFYNWSGIGNATQYVGLRHFQTVATDPLFWNAFRNTLIYACTVVPIQLTLALVLAIILNNPRMRLRTLYRTVFFIPVVTSAAIIAEMLRTMLSNFGTSISTMLGIDPPINPLASPQWALIIVIAFGIWQTFGTNMVLFLAALQTVPEELYDAAKIDGAAWTQTLRFITLPVIRPIGTVILFLSILGSLQVFEQSFVLTGGGPARASEVVSGYIYNFAFASGGPGGNSSPANLGYAAAASLFMSLIIMLISATQLVITRRANKSRTPVPQNATLATS